MYSLQQLRAFVAVVEIGTVTGAAAVLRRTQPQVSRLISSLENELRFQLFDRDRHRLMPTQRGVRFYDEVKPALDGLDHIQDVGEGIRQDTEATLRILAPPQIAQTILPRALEKFSAQYPDRRYCVEFITRGAMGRWVSFHSFDVGIVSLPFEIPFVKVRPFAAVETAVVLPAGHPLSAKQVIDVHDLEGHPFIALNKSRPLRQRLDEIFERHNVKVAIRGETSTSISACEMVARGLGLTIVDVFVPIEQGAAVDYRLWRPGYKSQFGLIYPASGLVSNATKDFSDIIVDIALEPGKKYITRFNLKK